MDDERHGVVSNDPAKNCPKCGLSITSGGGCRGHEVDYSAAWIVGIVAVVAFLFWMGGCGQEGRHPDDVNYDGDQSCMANPAAPGC